MTRLNRELPSIARRGFLLGAAALPAVSLPAAASALVGSRSEAPAVTDMRRRFDAALAEYHVHSAAYDRTYEAADHLARKRIGMQVSDHIEWDASSPRLREAWEAACKEVNLTDAIDRSNSSCDRLCAIEREVFEDHAGDGAWLPLQAHVFRTWIMPDLWKQPVDELDWEKLAMRIIIEQVLPAQATLAA